MPKEEYIEIDIYRLKWKWKQISIKNMTDSIYAGYTRIYIIHRPNDSAFFVTFSKMDFQWIRGIKWINNLYRIKYGTHLALRKTPQPVTNPGFLKKSRSIMKTNSMATWISWHVMGPSSLKRWTTTCFTTSLFSEPRFICWPMLLFGRHRPMCVICSEKYRRTTLTSTTSGIEYIINLGKSTFSWELGKRLQTTLHLLNYSPKLIVSLTCRIDL